MNKIFKFILIIFFLFNFFDIKSFELKSLNFYEWYNQSTKNEIKEEDFFSIIKQSNKTHIKIFNDKDAWPLISQDDFPPFQNNLKKLSPQLPEYIFKPEKDSSPVSEIKIIFPYSVKLITPASFTTYVFGDLHANFNDLSYILTDLIENEKVIHENFELSKNINLIFLGDYTDRGPNSLELLTTLMILKIKNPYNVFLLRGNHEDLVMNILYGFHDEIFNKIKDDENRKNIIEQIAKSYELMPATFYLGNKNQTKFIHLSHAGFEIRNNPKEFIESEIKNNQNLQFYNIKKIPFEMAEKIFSTNNFDHIILYYLKQSLNEILYTLWNDFYEFNENEIILEDSQRGNGSLKHNYKFMEYVLQKYELKDKFVKFIRGHSHNHVKFPEREPPLDDNEFIKQCNRFSKGVTSINKKVITLISGSIKHDNYNMNFLPTYLKLTQQGTNKDWHIEAKYLNEELLD